MAESDELQTVDVDHVCGRKHYIVNTVHMEEGGAVDAARKSPFAGKTNRMPRRDESGSRS